MTKNFKIIFICLCVAVVGLGVSTGILALKCNHKQVASTFTVSQHAENKLTVNSFINQYNQYTMGEKISKFNEITLQNGQIVKYCENSSGNVIRLHLNTDGDTISSIDIRTSNLIPLSKFVNPDYSNVVETIMYISDPNQDCVKILEKLGIIGDYSGSKQVKAGNIDYEYSIESPTDSLSSDIANLTIYYP